MVRGPRVRFSVREMMVVAGVAGAGIGLLMRALASSDFPEVPGLNMLNVGPDRVDPFPGRTFDEVKKAVNEAPGRGFLILLDSSNNSRIGLSTDPRGPQ